MRLERLKTIEHRLYGKAMELYRQSFPYSEQRETLSQEKILNDEAYYFYLVHDEEIFAGLLLCWETEEFVYIEHLCVFPEMRNKRYGQRILKLLKKQTEKRIVLEIDPPIEEIAVRRKGFYERNGFRENPYEHKQMPFHKGEQPSPLRIMSYPDLLSRDEYDRLNDYLQNHVMADVF